MLRRLILGLGANAFGQAVTILIQLVSLPLFLLFWDASTYGTWLLLSALPGYLNMADAGIVSVSGNTMTMAIGRGDWREADIVYHSAQAFMAVVCVGLALVLTPAALFWPSSEISSLNMRVALAALLGAVLVSLYGGLSDAVFKATERYALGTALGQVARLAEWAGYMVGLMLFRSFAGVAVLGLVGRVLVTVVMVVVAQRGQEGLTLGVSKADRSEFRTMLRPAASFMIFPLTNALSFQGVTLIVGALAGTSAVAIFNTYRTMARVAVQITSMFSHALWPEFAKLFGQAGLTGVYPLFRRSALIGAVMAAVFSPILFAASPWLLDVWTHGRIVFEPTLMALLLAYAAIGGIWHVPRVLLMSTNRHAGLAGWSLLASVLCVGLAWWWGRTWELKGVGAAMLVSETVIAVICIYLANRSFTEVRASLSRGGLPPPIEAASSTEQTPREFDPDPVGASPHMLK